MTLRSAGGMSLNMICVPDYIGFNVPGAGVSAGDHHVFDIFAGSCVEWIHHEQYCNDFSQKNEYRSPENIMSAKEIIRNILNSDCLTSGVGTAFYSHDKINIYFSGELVAVFKFTHISIIEVRIINHDLASVALGRKGFELEKYGHKAMHVSRYPPVILGIKNGKFINPAKIGAKCASCGKVFQKLNISTSVLHGSTCDWQFYGNYYPWWAKPY